MKDIRRATRKQYAAEEKIRIVLEGLRGEESIAELCRREGIAESLYYNWSKEFLEAGKRRLAGDTARAATSDEVKDLRQRDRGSEGSRRRAGAGTAAAQKKHDRGWGRRRMRYPASEKLEIIRLVEQSHLPARRTLEKLGIPRATFYRWYDRFLTGGAEALEDRRPRPKRVWNRIPDEVRERIVELALDRPELSPRELAVRFTDTESYFVSEASVYRLLKAHDLITSPAFIVIKAADEFKDKTTAPEPALADRLHLSEGHRLGLVLSVDHPRRLLPLHHRLEAVHDDEGRGRHRHAEPGACRIRLRQRQGHASAAAADRQRPELHRRRPGRMALGQRHRSYPRRAQPSSDPGQDRALAPDAEEPHPAGELLPARRSRSPDRSLRRPLQPPPLPREPRQSHARPTSTSAAARPSCWNEKGSSDKTIEPATLAASQAAA